MDIMNFKEMLSSPDIYSTPYKFPCEEYNIIGDTAEIDKILYAAGIINLDFRDIEKALSKETTNYVSTGSAEGIDCFAKALEDAFEKLPIKTWYISKLLFNIWMSKNMFKNSEFLLTEMELMMDFIRNLPKDVDVVWGIAFDESMEGPQVRVSLIAASR